MIAVLFVAALSIVPAQVETSSGNARTLYVEGQRDYEREDWDSAIEKFLHAYGITGARDLLFNIAQAYRRKGDCGLALEYYRRYLRSDRAIVNRAEVEERIREMTRCPHPAAQQEVRVPPRDASRSGPDEALALVAPSATSTPAITASAPVEDRSTSVAPLIVAVSGAGLVAVGGILNWRAHAKYDDVRTTCPCAPGSFDGWQAATSASVGLLVAGGVAIAIGAGWWAFDQL
jgi:hypothetical protein